MIWIAILPLILLVYRLLRYLTTPLLKKVGVYRYYSPMFFTVSFSQSLREIHLGTPWDFFNPANRASSSRIFGFLATGLYRLTESVERGEIAADVRFRGMIHYFNQESISRFGFRLRQPDVWEWVLFSLGYLELCLLTSLARKQLTFIRPSDLRVVVFTASDLIRHKHRFEGLARKLVPDLFTLSDSHPVSQSA